MKDKTWKVEITVAGLWLEDGFTLKPDALKDAILSEMLPWATEGEVRVKVIGEKREGE